MLESFKKTFVRGREKQGKTDAASHNAGNAAAAEAIAARGGADAGKAECSHPPPGVANPTAPIRPDPNKEIAEENLSHFAEPPLMLSSDISGHEKQVLFISTGAANTRPVRGPRRDEDEDEEEGDEGEEEEGEEEDEEEELADKLHLLFDFNDPKELEEDKEYNRRFLLELVDYVNCGTMKFNEAVFKDITRMLEINLFRPLPPSAPAMSGSEPKNPKEEDPTMEAAWSHLQIVYELLKYVVFNETDQRLKLFVDQQFILKLLNLFDSEDPRERDYLKSILHRIYLKFMDHRQFIRKAINDIFDQFIESERHNGIAELLELLGSFVNGFVLPLEEEHTQSLERVLVPLHKLECVSMYHKQLSFCITQFVEKDPKLADLVLRGLLKFWPLTNSQKEVLFLGELEKILELTQAPEFQMVMTPLFQQIARCLSSPHSEVRVCVMHWEGGDMRRCEAVLTDRVSDGHDAAVPAGCTLPQLLALLGCTLSQFLALPRCNALAQFQVARRVLFLGNNDYIVRLVAQNRTTILPLIFPALDRNARSHQNEVYTCMHVLDILTLSHCISPCFTHPRSISRLPASPPPRLPSSPPPLLPASPPPRLPSSPPPLLPASPPPLLPSSPLPLLPSSPPPRLPSSPPPLLPSSPPPLLPSFPPPLLPSSAPPLLPSFPPRIPSSPPPLLPSSPPPLLPSSPPPLFPSSPPPLLPSSPPPLLPSSPPPLLPSSPPSVPSSPPPLLPSFPPSVPSSPPPLPLCPGSERAEHQRAQQVSEYGPGALCQILSTPSRSPSSLSRHINVRSKFLNMDQALYVKSSPPLPAPPPLCPGSERAEHQRAQQVSEYGPGALCQILSTPSRSPSSLSRQ
ncbi:unnamed protein product [Closterium sp. Naga37s-1]|nr:unnamed protein product [Closterium sp. Naga37s-1]